MKPTVTTQNITIELVGGPANGTTKVVKTLTQTVTIPDPSPACATRKAVYILGQRFSPGGVRQYHYRGAN